MTAEQPTISANAYRRLYEELRRAFAIIERTPSASERAELAVRVRRALVDLVEAGPNCPKAKEDIRTITDRLVARATDWLNEQGL